MIKTTGAEFRAFYTDPAIWKEGVYHEDGIFLVGGEELDFSEDLESVPPNVVMKIDGGVIFDGDERLDFEKVFRKWKKARTVVVLAIEVKRADEDAMTEAVKRLGGRVLR